MMRMIPESAGLSGDGEIIEERISRDDWALGDSDRAICPLGPTLKETVPVLNHIQDQITRPTMQIKKLTMLVVSTMVESFNLLCTLILNLPSWETHHEGILHMKRSESVV